MEQLEEILNENNIEIADGKIKRHVKTESSAVNVDSLIHAIQVLRLFHCCLLWIRIPLKTPIFADNPTNYAC